MSRDVT